MLPAVYPQRLYERCARCDHNTDEQAVFEKAPGGIHLSWRKRWSSFSPAAERERVAGNEKESSENIWKLKKNEKFGKKRFSRWKGACCIIYSLHAGRKEMNGKERIASNEERDLLVPWKASLGVFEAFRVECNPFSGLDVLLPRVAR